MAKVVDVVEGEGEGEAEVRVGDVVAMEHIKVWTSTSYSWTITGYLFCCLNNVLKTIYFSH